MDRSPRIRFNRKQLNRSQWAILLLFAPSMGCHALMATGIYIWEGGNVVPAECDALEGQRVVVVCRPPSSSEYSHAGASRQLSRAVTNLLRKNVPKIEMVDPREVDEWLDESDWKDFTELGRAVKADRLLVIDLAHFDLYKHKTLYQGSADVTLTVYDMEQGEEILWEQPLGDVLFPQHSAIPAQDKPVQQFQREYIGILSQSISVYFYKHDPTADFAMDAMANR